MILDILRRPMLLALIVVVAAGSAIAFMPSSAVAAPAKTVTYKVVPGYTTPGYRPYRAPVIKKVQAVRAAKQAAVTPKKGAR